MPYVWINPVTNSMYEPKILDEFLQNHGYRRFHTSVDWLAIVKEKYRLAAHDSEHAVMDMRCPKIKELLEEMEIVSNMTIPDIKPILIHCGQEAGIREDLQGEEEIRNYFEKGIPNGVQLVEMLYCKDGCHNGDGIKRCGI